MLIQNKIVDYFDSDLPPPIVQTDPKKWLIKKRSLWNQIIIVFNNST